MVRGAPAGVCHPSTVSARSTQGAGAGAAGAGEASIFLDPVFTTKKGSTTHCDMLCMYAIHTDCDSPPPAPPELVSMGRTHVLQLDTSTAPPPQTKTHHSRDTSVPGERFSSCCFKWLVHRRGPWAPGRLPYAPAGGGGRWLSCAVLRSSASPSLSIISCTHSEMASEMAGETRPSEGGA